MRNMKKRLRNFPILKISLAVNCILFSLAGCEQAPQQSTDTVPAVDPASEVISVPAPPRRTGDQLAQLKPESIPPSPYSLPDSSYSRVTASPSELQEESSLQVEEQELAEWEFEQEERPFSTEEYADAQAEALLNSPPSPSDWLDRIEERVLVGEPEEAKAAMDAFFLIYPDYPVDEPLLERIYESE